MLQTRYSSSTAVEQFPSPTSTRKISKFQTPPHSLSSFITDQKTAARSRVHAGIVQRTVDRAILSLIMSRPSMAVLCVV